MQSSTVLLPLAGIFRATSYGQLDINPHGELNLLPRHTASAQLAEAALGGHMTTVCTSSAPAIALVEISRVGVR